MVNINAVSDTRSAAIAIKLRECWLISQQQPCYLPSSPYAECFRRQQCGQQQPCYLPSSPYAECFRRQQCGQQQPCYLPSSPQAECLRRQQCGQQWRVQRRISGTSVTGAVSDQPKQFVAEFYSCHQRHINGQVVSGQAHAHLPTKSSSWETRKSPSSPSSFSVRLVTPPTPTPTPLTSTPPPLLDDANDDGDGNQ
jgi:hypothetical protein